MDETYLQVKGQGKYLYRAVKRIVRLLLGFQSFHTARVTLAGMELAHMLKKGQMIAAGGKKLFAARQFYSLAA